MERPRRRGKPCVSIRLAAAAVLCAAAVILALLSTGCAKKHDSSRRLGNLEFTVPDIRDVPQEMQDMIAEREKEPFRITYADQGMLYIAEGYGEQPTTGYSVEVKELYETEDAVRIRTNLLGPKSGEEKLEITTFPYVVVQLGYVEKDVLFE